MKKLVVILFVFIALIGTGVYFVLPTNIDWNKYIQETAGTVKSRTGLTLTVQGTPVFSMKSVPVLKTGRIVLGNVANASYPQIMTAESAEILFDTASLFRRRIKIKKITLLSPRLYFEAMSDGKWNWQSAFFDRTMAGGGAIGFDSLLLTNGLAEVKKDKYTPAQKWERVNVELFADSTQGPFFLEGNFGAINSTFGFSLKVEKFITGQSPDFALRLINASAESSFVFTGKYGLTETERGMLTGVLSFDIRKPDRFFELLYPQEKLPQEVFQPVVGNLKLKKNSQTRTSEMTEVLFKYGNSTATGNLTVRSLSPQEASFRQAQEEDEEWEDSDIVLRDPKNPSEAVSLNDIPVAQTKMAENLLPKVVNGSFIFSRLDSDPFVKNAVPLITFLSKSEHASRSKNTYTLDMVFDTVNYKKDIIHQLKSNIVSVEDGVAFNDVSMTLPGNTYVTGQAKLKTDQTLLLSGRANVQADNINSVLNWLDVRLPEEIPQNLLQHFDGETEFKLASNGLILSPLKGKLDQTDFSGNVAFRFKGRKALSLSLTLSDLGMAQYFPVTSKAFAESRSNFAQSSLSEKIQTVFDGLKALDGLELNAKLKASNFSWADINAENLNADFSFVRGQMKINDISADKVFASLVKMYGELEGFGATPTFNGFGINIDAQQLSSLTQVFGISVPRSIAGQDKMRLSAKMTGTLQSMSIDADTDFGTSRFAFQGNVRQSAPSVFDWNGSVDVYHENFRNFIRLFADNYRPVLANPGAVKVRGQMLSNPQVFHLTDMTAKIGENEVTGSLKIVPQKDRSVITVDLNAQDFAPLGMLPRMNFADSIAVNMQKNAFKNIWTENGTVSRFVDDLNFSQKVFDFSFLGKYEATVSLKAEKFFLNSFLLTNLDGVIKISPDKVVLDLRRSLWNRANFGGIFNLIPNAGKLSVQAAMRVSNLDIPADLFASKTADVGDLENVVVNANLKAEGKSAKELFSSLSGTGTLAFDSALLKPIDIDNVWENIKKIPDVSKEDALISAMRGGTEINRFQANVQLANGLFVLHPVEFSFNGEENKSATFSYNYLNKVLSASVSFPSGMKSINAIELVVDKKMKQNAVLTQNIEEVFDSVVAMKNALKEQDLERRKQQRLKEEEEQRKIKDARFQRLKKVDERLTMAAADLNEKLSNVTPLAQKVYHVDKYMRSLEKMSETLKGLEDEVQKNLSDDGLTDDTIEVLERKVESDYFSKEEDVNNDYNAAMKVGIKGGVFDIQKEANDVYRQIVKLQTMNSDLPEITQNVDEIKKEYEEMKKLHTQSESEDIKLDELTVVLAQAEAVLEKIKEGLQKSEDAVEQKKLRIAEEEKARKEAEELKKKQEEEAKKAAEEAAAAEKAKKEAEERERQRTIFRKSGKASSAKSSSGTSVSLQPVSSSETATASKQGAENEKKETVEKKASPIVIRKR